MSSFHHSLHTWLQQAWIQAHHCDLPLRGMAMCQRPELADLTHSGALLGAKLLQQSPRALAQQWFQHLPPHPFVKQVDIAGPGYLNIQLSEAGWKALLDNPEGPFEMPPVPEPTLIEFVSANPTGPLHLGHARQAVLGDVLAKLLKKLGGKVGTEFFYNDAGEQINMLTLSVELRLKELQGAVLKFERDKVKEEDLQEGELLFPLNAYHGGYIQEVAKAWLLNPEQDLTDFAIAYLSQEQHDDLTHLGVHFDTRVSEKSLYDSGEVKDVVNQLLHHAYQATHDKQSPPPINPHASHAWFLETSPHGDDKDRVMIKANGSYTYFVPDVAYHLNKWKRGWKHAINIQGSDHHGTLARVQAGVQLACPEIGPNYPEVMFHTMIKVVKNGIPVKASKRAGDYLTAREIADQIGVGAFRLSMLDKKPDTPMKLDIDQWLVQSAQSPVYSIQYAYARLKKALEKMEQQEPGSLSQPILHASEQQLLLGVGLWEDRILGAAQDHEPTRVSLLTRELASSIHNAYQQGPKLLKLDKASQDIRKQLYQQVLKTLENAGQLLGFKYEPLAFSKDHELQAFAPQSLPPSSFTPTKPK